MRKHSIFLEVFTFSLLLEIVKDANLESSIFKEISKSSNLMD